MADPRLLSPGEEGVPAEWTDERLRPAINGSSIEIDMFRLGGVASSIPVLLFRRTVCGLSGDELRARDARLGLSGRANDVLGIDLEKLVPSRDDLGGSSYRVP